MSGFLSLGPVLSSVSLWLHLNCKAGLPCCPPQISGSPIQLIRWWGEGHCYLFSIHTLSFLLEGDDAGEGDDPIQHTVRCWKDVPQSVSAGTCCCVLQYDGTCCGGWAYSPSNISKLCNKRRTIIVHLLGWEKYSNSRSNRYCRKASYIRPYSYLQPEILSQAMFWSFTKQFTYMAWGTDVPGCTERCFNSESQRKVWNAGNRIT